MPSKLKLTSSTGDLKLQIPTFWNFKFQHRCWNTTSVWDFFITFQHRCWNSSVMACPFLKASPSLKSNCAGLSQIPTPVLERLSFLQFQLRFSRVTEMSIALKPAHSRRLSRWAAHSKCTHLSVRTGAFKGPPQGNRATRPGGKMSPRAGISSSHLLHETHPTRLFA